MDSITRSDRLLGFLSADVVRLLRRRFERALDGAGLGLTAAQARTLAYVHVYEGARQAALAERMGIEPMTLVRFLDQLAEAGLVERRPDPADRRANIVVLTPAATPVLAQMQELGAAIRAEATRGMAPEAVEALLDGLRRVRANLQDGAGDEDEA
ncbi:MAG TPA: MarR family transcriptional regulator [Alphaproteobacteria bacterium]|nr:MarR family transcriptional regulator [Alphaproteobacteria bacterium]